MKNQKGSYGKVSEKKQYRFSFVSIDAENRKLIALKNLAKSNEKINHSESYQIPFNTNKSCRIQLNPTSLIFFITNFGATKGQ